jgi:hypothetical protein
MKQFSLLNIFFIAGVTAIGTAMVFLRPDSLSLLKALLAIAIVIVGGVPAVVYLLQPAAKRSTFPLMSLTGVFYGVFFGLPAFFTDFLSDPTTHKIRVYEAPPLNSISLEAQILVLVGLSTMLLVWSFSKNKVFHFLPKFTLPTPHNPNAVIALAWALAIANISYDLFPVMRTIPSIGQFLQPAGYVAFAIFLISLMRKELSRANCVAYFCVLLPAWIAVLFTTGFLTSILLLAVLYLALSFCSKQSFPWKTILLVLLLFVIVYPNVTLYRYAAWRQNPDMTIPEKVLSFIDIVGSASLKMSFGDKPMKPRFGGLVMRVSLILPMSHVVESTPEKIEYWNGATYKTLFIGWIPRFIWRDKPEERWGNEFGRRYNFLSDSNRSMSLNIPWIIEMYANFGRFGVVFGMALVGLFLGAFDRLLNSPQAKPLEQAIGASILLPLFYQESNFTVMTGSLLPLIACLWLYFAVGLRLKFPFKSS